MRHSLLEDPQEDTWVEDIDELPPRPRTRLLTPLTGGLLALLLVAGGFIGGVLVQKGQQTSGGGGGNAGGAARVLAQAKAGGAGGPGGGAQPTFGQVTNVQGRTLYVTTAQGNTVKVRVPKGASVTRTSSSSVGKVHPGDTVVVQGTTHGNGSVSASSVRATSQGAGGGSAGGGGSSVLDQLFGAGGGK